MRGEATKRRERDSLDDGLQCSLLLDPPHSFLEESPSALLGRGIYKRREKEKRKRKRKSKSKSKSKSKRGYRCLQVFRWSRGRGCEVQESTKAFSFLEFVSKANESFPFSDPVCVHKARSVSAFDSLHH
jgi:rhamnogalacturonyl hydrolase YesR